MKMFSTFICAAIATTTTLVIAHSGRCRADYIRGRDVTSTLEVQRANRIRKWDLKSNLPPRFLEGLDNIHNSSESCINHVKSWREGEVFRVRYPEKEKNSIPRAESTLTDSVLMQLHHQQKLKLLKNVEPVTKMASNSIALARDNDTHYIQSSREWLFRVDDTSSIVKATRQVTNERLRHDAPFEPVTNSAIAGSDMANSKPSFIWYRRKRLTLNYSLIDTSSGRNRVEAGTLRLNEGIRSEVLLYGQSASNLIIGEVESPRERKSTNDVWSRWKVQESQDEVKLRIIGGQPAKITEFPFMAYLELREEYRCCMNIMTAKWLITARHCIIDPTILSVEAAHVDLNSFAVVAGSTLVTTNMTRECDKEQVRRNVERLVLHPEFNLTQLRNDLALVAVTKPLPFTNKIHPAKLPDRPMDAKRHLVDGRRCYVTGWGETSASRRSKLNNIPGRCFVGRNLHALPILHKVTLPVLSVPSCLELCNSATSFLSESCHICSVSWMGKDAWYGDSGAPLICDGFVVALVTGGMKCGNATPTLYTRIDTQLPWIKATTGRRNLASQPPDFTVIIIVTLGLPATALGSICRM